MERSRRDPGWTPTGEQWEEGGGQVGIQADLRGANQKEPQSYRASQWEQRLGEGGVEGGRRGVGSSGRCYSLECCGKGATLPPGSLLRIRWGRGGSWGRGRRSSGNE